MKYIFIINTKAGKFNCRQEIENQINNLQNKIPYEIYETKAQKDATNFVNTYIENNLSEEVCFVACGGDGTINEVANALVNKLNKHLAVLAFGSGNDFVKYYKGKDFKSVEKLVEGTTQKIDIIKVNDYYSINVCNFGFDSVVCSTANKIKQHRGKHAYTRGIIKAAFVGRSNKIDVFIDGEKISKKKMLLCTLANCHYVGERYFCAPRALNNDGYFDVCHAHTMNIFKFLSMIKPYKLGKHLDNPKYKKKIVYKRGKHAEVKSKKEIELSIDGELIKGTHFIIDLLPQAVNFIVPKD